MVPEFARFCAMLRRATLFCTILRCSAQFCAGAGFCTIPALCRTSSRCSEPVSYTHLTLPTICSV
eukprot:6220441-Alexandrium_andersonii.AAC.1